MLLKDKIKVFRSFYSLGFCCLFIDLSVVSTCGSIANTIASIIFLTKWNLTLLMTYKLTFYVIFSLTSFGKSSISFLFLSGRITLFLITKSFTIPLYLLSPLAYAAKHFSFIPPTGSTAPFNDISPVIATSFITFLFVKIET